jgi:glycine oxidase
MDVEFRENGKLHVALTEADESHLVALAEAGGRDVELIDATATHALEPALSTRIRSALFIRRDARVDNRRLGHALWQAAEGAGARFHLGRSVVRVVAGAADFRVHLDDGSTLNTTQMVVAAGAWSDAIEGVPDVPVRPVRGQMLAVSAAVLRRTIHSHGCYLVPRDDGRILIGATVEDVGFEQGPTPAGIQRLLAASLELVPALADAPIVESWAGYRPGTPDEMPILGEDPDVPRLFWAAGHFRNGILLAPITAEILGRALVGEPIPEIAPFSIRRFRQT